MVEPSRLEWVDEAGTSLQRLAFMLVSRRPMRRSLGCWGVERFWVLASVAAAGLLVSALQWQPAAQAEAPAQISTDNLVGARSPQPQNRSDLASVRPGPGQNSSVPLAPAVSATAASDEPAWRKHRFALVGTTITGDRRMALLREIASGESGIVDEGGQVGGVTVAVVQADHVLLRSGGFTEELQLQTASNAQEPLASQAPSIRRAPTVMSNVAAAPGSERAPNAASPYANIRALLEQGIAVPNPD
jgi:hypothetical protein